MLLFDEWQSEIMQVDKHCYRIRQWMLYNSYKIFFSLDHNLQYLFTSLSAFTILTPYSPKGYPADRVVLTLFTVLPVQPITYTVSSCLATGRNRFNFLNGMSQSHAAHKWLSKSHQLTLTLTLTYQLWEEKITTDVIVINLLCVLCLTTIRKSLGQINLKQL